jgi:RNA polymerase sigma factor (TIGR02999 family)
MSDVTRILGAACSGDPQAAHQLLPLVYDELRRLAAQKLAQEPSGQTLQPTALVHEVYLRLVASEQQRDAAGQEQHWANRGHFFAAAAEAMRRILIDHARRRHSQKRGGDRTRQEIDPGRLASEKPSEDLLALDEALHQLAAAEPQVAQLVKLRYFVGLTIPQAAAVLGIAPRTADSWWAYARAWLLAALQGEGKG